jgi:hypothetical protein
VSQDEVYHRLLTKLTGGKLYHVTSHPQASRIRREGFKTNMPTPEEIGIPDTEDDNYDSDEYHSDTTSDEETAREAFDSVMEDARQKVAPHATPHRGSVFFWAHPGHAETAARDAYRPNRAIIEVPHEHVGSNAWIGDWRRSTDVFDTLRDHADHAHAYNCANECFDCQDAGYDDCRVIQEAQRHAEDFWRSARPFKPGDRGHKLDVPEVWTSDELPPPTT